MKIFVDADACPVKEEVYRVAGRYRFEVTLVSNSSLYVPADALVRLVIVRNREHKLRPQFHPGVA